MNYQDGEWELIKNVKQGEFIRRKPEAKRTFTRDHYIREDGYNRYCCTDAEDIGRSIFLKPNTKVLVGFTY